MPVARPGHVCSSWLQNDSAVCAVPAHPEGACLPKSSPLKIDVKGELSFRVDVSAFLAALQTPPREGQRPSPRPCGPGLKAQSWARRGQTVPGLPSRAGRGDTAPSVGNGGAVPGKRKGRGKEGRPYHIRVLGCPLLPSLHLHGESAEGGAPTPSPKTSRQSRAAGPGPRVRGAGAAGCRSASPPYRGLRGRSVSWRWAFRCILCKYPWSPPPAVPRRRWEMD